MTSLHSILFCQVNVSSSKNIGLLYNEQVRWAEMAAAQGGRSVASLVADFNVASKALDQQWQALSNHLHMMTTHSHRGLTP